MKIHSKILSIFLTSQINAYWLTARWPILVCIMLWTLRWASFPNFAQEDWRLDRLRSYYCIQLLHHLAFQSSGTPQVMPFGVLLLRVVRRVSDLQNPFFPPSKIIFGDFKIQIKFFNWKYLINFNFEYYTLVTVFSQGPIVSIGISNIFLFFPWRSYIQRVRHVVRTNPFTPNIKSDL